MREMPGSIAANLEARAAGFSNLEIVTCHGDCHGWNAMMSDATDGGRVASFLDFDEPSQTRQIGGDKFALTINRQILCARRSRYCHEKRGNPSFALIPRFDSKWSAARLSHCRVTIESHYLATSFITIHKHIDEPPDIQELR